MVIGITGGVGAGKSTITKIIAEYDSTMVIDTDSLAKEIMANDQEIKQQLQNAFGTHILDNNRNIKTLVLANEVFSDGDKLKRLNCIVHPIVVNKIKEIIKLNKEMTIFIECATLMQTELRKLCNEVWLVYADTLTRINRIVKNRGYTVKRAKDMIMRQSGAYDYTFDQIIHNNDSDNVKEEIEKLIKKY